MFFERASRSSVRRLPDFPGERRRRSHPRPDADAISLFTCRTNHCPTRDRSARARALVASTFGAPVLRKSFRPSEVSASLFRVSSRPARAVRRRGRAPRARNGRRRLRSRQRRRASDSRRLPRARRRPGSANAPPPSEPLAPRASAASRGQSNLLCSRKPALLVRLEFSPPGVARPFHAHAAKTFRRVLLR